MKREFLVVHDYGMGGVWAVVVARSRSEIEGKFREVTVVEARPDWMSVDRYEDLQRESQDIDQPPRGWLRELAAERD